MLRLKNRSVLWGFAALAALGPLWPATACRFANRLDNAERLMRAGEFAQALSELRQITASAPACDPDQYHLLAVAWLNLKSNENALAAAERGLHVFPESVPLQQYYVSLLAAASPKTEVAARLDRQLALTPKSPVYQKALAVVLLDQDPESQRAGRLLAKALQGAPHDIESRCYYAKWLCTTHREQEAVRHLDQALEDGPTDEIQESIYRLKAAAEDRLNHVDAAQAAYEKAVELDRRRPHAGYAAELEYAEFWMRRSEDRQAERVLRGLLAHAPRVGLAHFDLARILGHANQFEGAIQEATMALSYAPGAAEQRPIRAFLIRTMHAAGRDEEARMHEEWMAAH